MRAVEGSIHYGIGVFILVIKSSDVELITRRLHCVLVQDDRDDLTDNLRSNDILGILARDLVLSLQYHDAACVVKITVQTYIARAMNVCKAVKPYLKGLQNPLLFWNPFPFDNTFLSTNLNFELVLVLRFTNLLVPLHISTNFARRVLHHAAHVLYR